MNSVWKLTFGTPEEKTPATLLSDLIHNDLPPETKLATVDICPVHDTEIEFTARPRGCTLTIPVGDGEQFFGLGLQLKSVAQRGKKKTLRVNSDPTLDLGDSHAPVPFFLSSAGYGVYVDTARYASFWFASHVKNENAASAESAAGADDTETLYRARNSANSHILIDIPAAQGVDIYIFGGPDMLSALRRYNMFSGGGVRPPMWGLGIWYRTWGNSKQADVLAQADEIRADKLPCDVFGIEPGWQTRAYSCSYVWNSGNYPDHEKMLKELTDKGFRVNLWEHLYVNPEAPIYDEQKTYAGDYKVWNGLVPDLSVPAAEKSYTEYHNREFISQGIDGFKIDECDNSDFIVSPWSYPEASAFPSGLDGEQMHALMGMLAQRAFNRAYRASGKRTWSLVRSSGALASSMPFTLYSDLYNLSDFIRGMVTSGFSGLLWSPEVRQCTDEEDLLRRLQTLIFSPVAQLNCWMVPHPVWLQYDGDKNHAGEFIEDGGKLLGCVKALFELRMKLLPYLYNAFADYERTGMPPFRALALDFSADARTFDISDEYMIGADLLFAPLLTHRHERNVYLPSGVWYNFFNRERYEGGEYVLRAEADELLLFVREGTLIPAVKPVECVRAYTVFELEPLRFGEGELSCSLTEDDGETFDYKNGKENRVTLTSSPDGAFALTRQGSYSGVRYILPR